MLYLMISTEGHSCSPVVDLAQRLKCDASEIDKCLIASGLCAVYQDRIITKYQSKPFSLVNVEGIALVYISKYLNYEQSIVTKVKELIALPEINNSTANYQQALQQLQTLSTVKNYPNSEQLAAIIAVIKI